MVAWYAVTALSVGALFFAASRHSPEAVIAIAAVTAAAFIAMAIRERSALARANASRSRIGAATSRHMGLVWLWGAASLLIIYVFALVWAEWWHFCLAFAAVGALCLGYATLLERDARAGREDETMLALGRYLAIGQLIGMVVTVIGLAIDPDKELTWIREGDWAGNIVCLFGAASLAIITAHALRNDKRPG